MELGGDGLLVNITMLLLLLREPSIKWSGLCNVGIYMLGRDHICNN